MTDHIPEEDLALYAFHREAVTAERRVEIEAHVGVCAVCQSTLDFFASGEGDLADPDTWEPIVGSETYTSLMDYGARVAAEDEEAEELLHDYIANPVSAAWSVLRTKKVLRTGGVVRKLNDHAHSIVEDDPLAALTFADASIGIAELLADDAYPAGAVNQLRATAWKERANALMWLGGFPAAHDALDHAERFYRKTMNGNLGMSMVALVRAGVFFEQGRYDVALEYTERAERGFFYVGDEKRRLDAVYLRGLIFMEAGDPSRALELYSQLIDYGESTDNARLIARGSYVSGHAEVDRGNLGAASMFFHRALVLYREVGPGPERTSTEWGLARVLMKGGRLDDAIRRLRDAQAAYEQQSQVTDAALVGLDIAECLLALGKPQKIVPLAQHLFRIFKDAGMLTGALSAIAYLKEAATATSDARLTVDDLEEIRRFIRRAERQPALVFVPPPRRDE